MKPAARWAPALLMAAAAVAHGQVPPKSAQDTKTYASKPWRWSISYPAGWTLEAGDPDLVRVRSAASSALCSINSGAMDRFNNVDELTDFMLANDAQFFKDKGQKFTVLSRQRIALPNGVAGSDVLAEIDPGQRSRRIYALADGRGFAIDCETSVKNWASVEAEYKRVIASFTVRK